MFAELSVSNISVRSLAVRRMRHVLLFLFFYREHMGSGISRALAGLRGCAQTVKRKDGADGMAVRAIRAF